MKTLLRRWCALWCIATALFTLPAHAATPALALPEGLNLHPPATLDYTYQVVPAYDDKQKVLALWHGQTLQGFMAIEALPASHADPELYLPALERDLARAWGGITRGQAVRYTTADGMRATAQPFTQPNDAKTGEAGAIVIAHHLSNGKAAFLLSATVVPPAALATVMQQSIALLRTAEHAPQNAALPRNARSEDELLGTWVTTDDADSGGATSRLNLMADLTFSLITTDAKGTASRSGIWYRQGGRLYWTLMYGSPPLPDGRKIDEEFRIERFEGDTLVLTGGTPPRQRTYQRTYQRTQ